MADVLLRLGRWLSTLYFGAVGERVGIIYASCNAVYIRISVGGSRTLHTLLYFYTCVSYVVCFGNSDMRRGVGWLVGWLVG